MRLEDVAEWLQQDRRPPVESWDPPHRGASGMRIAADGTWFHDGAPIRRERLVRLFASVLRRDGEHKDGEFVLVTPVEKLSIEVEDAPFVASEVTMEGEGRARQIAFRLNIGDYVIAGAEHPLVLRTAGGSALPYVLARPGLPAKIARAPWLELAEAAVEEGAEPPGLWSGGTFFPLGNAEA